MMKETKKWVVLSTPFLGDSVYMGIIAASLAAKYQHVTLISNTFHQFSHMVSSYKIERYNSAKAREAIEAADYLLTNSSHQGSIIETLENDTTLFDAIKSNLVSIALAGGKGETGRCQWSVNPEHPLHRFHSQSYRQFGHKTITKNITSVLTKTLNIPIDKSAGIMLPETWRKSSIKNRIVIQPNSGMQKKNSSLQFWNEISRQLLDQNFEVIWNVSAAQATEYKKKCDPNILMPGTSLPELAKLIFESRAIIGNDSGPIHLASLLGCPSFLIHYPKRLQFNWTADINAASQSITPGIFPFLLRPLMKHDNYKNTLSHHKAIKEILLFLDNL